ncbi:hypothetical protein ACN6MT_19505 [Neobacillus niacini]|uniref:hypothetical protein n=1 Tax=Neobacillus niacini TaxID=86668 RepID=UPI003B018BF4
MAIAAAINDTLISSIRAKVGVETKKHLTLGMTILDTRYHHVGNNLSEINKATAGATDNKRFNDLEFTIILE